MAKTKFDIVPVNEVDTGDVVYVGDDGQVKVEENYSHDEDRWAMVLGTKNTVTRGFSLCVQGLTKPEHEAEWQAVGPADTPVLVRSAAK